MEPPSDAPRPVTKKTGPETTGPDSYRYRYREKPDVDRKSPIRLDALTRTVALASVAFGAILLYLVRDMGLDGRLLIEYAKDAVVFVLTFLALGIVLGGLIVMVRRLFGRRPNVSLGAAVPDPDEAEKPDRSRD